MKGNEMLEAVGYVDEKLIVKGEKKKHRFPWKRLTAVAASICLLLGGALIYRHSQPQYASELLLVAENDIGMGEESYQAYDVSEIRRDNPADGVKLKALNAYRNTVTYDERQYPYGQDLEAMKEYLISLAEGFGLDTASLEIFDNAPGEDQMQGLVTEFASRGLEVPEYYSLPSQLWVKTEDLKITVEADMTATIKFTDGIPLPEQYRLDYDSTPDELTEAGEYLWEKYGNIIGYEDPRLCIDGGNYSTDGTQKYTLCFYEGSRDEAESFENYCFNYTEFTPKIIRIYSDKALEKIGLYPIIGEEEALRLLLDGRYYTNVTEEFPGKEAVVRCELTYLSGSKDKTMIPFYRFYVYLENAPAAALYPEGMKTYGAYYVPAVESAYLEKQ